MRVLRAVAHSLGDGGALDPQLTRQNRLGSWPRWQGQDTPLLQGSNEDTHSLPTTNPALDFARRASLAPALLSMEKQPLGSWWERRGSWAETQ